MVVPAIAILICLHAGPSSPAVVLAFHEPGHVIQDRRDELMGGSRPKLQGLRPRPKIEPRSRLTPKSQNRAAPRRDRAITPLRRPGPRPLPIARRLMLKSAIDACVRRYRSFDTRSGLYRTIAGKLRRCPYLP